MERFLLCEKTERVKVFPCWSTCYCLEKKIGLCAKSHTEKGTIRYQFACNKVSNMDVSNKR